MIPRAKLPIVWLLSAVRCATKWRTVYGLQAVPSSHASVGIARRYSTSISPSTRVIALISDMNISPRIRTRC
jgi:hypothetical protein